jgi:hypothetical protein
MKFDNKIFIGTILVIVLLLIVGAYAFSAGNKSSNTVTVTPMPTPKPSLVPSATATPMPSPAPTITPTPAPTDVTTEYVGGIVGGSYNGVPTPYPTLNAPQVSSQVGNISIVYTGDYDASALPTTTIYAPIGGGAQATLYSGPLIPGNSIAGIYGLYAVTVDGSYDNVSYNGGHYDISYTGSGDTTLSSGQATLVVNIVMTTTPV